MNYEKNHKEKGDELENAVELIYKQILKTNPSLASAQLQIQRNKLIFPGGVRREIDIYVVVDPGDGFESIFIFECKNIKKPVSPNDITIFSAKIKETNATKGYFIGTSFSSNAKKEALKDPRIELLVASKLPLEKGTFPEIHTIHQDKSNQFIEAQAFIKGFDDTKASKDYPIDPQGICTYQLEQMPFQSLLERFAEETISKKLKNLPTHTFDEGYYAYSIDDMIIFSDNEFSIERGNIEKIKIKVKFTIQVIKPITKAQFTVEGKGIYIKQYFNLPKGQIDVRAVRIHNRNKA